MTLFYISLVFALGLSYALFSMAMPTKLVISIWTLLGFCFLSLTFYGWSNHYTGQGITEATWYHLSYGLQGLSFKQFFPLLCTVALYVLLMGFLIWFRSKKHGSKKLHTPLVLLLSLGCLFFNPTLIVGATIMAGSINSEKLAQDMKKEMLPASTSSSPYRSVVYIYLEGMEGGLLHAKKFPDLTPNLAEIQRQSLSIRGIRQTQYTGWTIAGMVASQCGYPELEKGGNQEICLGDLLKKYGYELSYLNGSDVSFAGKGEFYHKHGFERVKGSEHLVSGKLLRSPLSEWGMVDEDLFPEVIKEVKRLKSLGRPFFLATLTVDTHPPYGFPSPVCQEHSYTKSSDPLVNSIHCSDWMVGNLVRAIEREVDDNTLIIIASDHLQPASTTVAKALGDEVHRENLWMVRGPVKYGDFQKEGSTYDIYPTLLNLMGSPVKGINLGRNLLGPEKTLLEKYGFMEFNRRIKAVEQHHEALKSIHGARGLN